MTDLDDMMTQPELEVEPCSNPHRHGPHTHEFIDVAQPTGVPAAYSEFQCPGEGLVTVSYSELDAYRQCALKHDLAYTQRWVKPVDDNTALGKGTMWHRVLETHYNTIKDHQVAQGNTFTWDCTAEELENYCKLAVVELLAEMTVVEDRDQETVNLMVWMYEGYVDRWGLDDDWDIIAVENTAIVPLYEADGSESWVRLKVKLDLLVRDSKGRYWIIDHKSCANLPAGQDFDFAEQFPLYAYALRKVGIKVTGAIHNACRTKRNQGDIFSPGDPGYKTTMKAQTLEERFDRTPLNYTAVQLDGIAGDALATFKQAYSDANHKRRSADPERCKWRCNFKEACLFGRRTGKDTDMIDMLTRTGFEQNFTRH